MDIPMECIFCKKSSGTGINILGEFICIDCEETLVNTDINDENYEIYRELIKKNIYGEIFLKEPSK
ncbi:inhibitor of sigma-G Gin [Oxobacter pfennigii]|uniref:Inhibitor of sigma-G Gin n=2 Tax=Oxobacter pfennigii TaxID=36849 RepID=A0A0P8WXI9_9CLOT|nr:inhibitor of sigma-G Gin [Oxobacter pfennigii]